MRKKVFSSLVVVLLIILIILAPFGYQKLNPKYKLSQNIFDEIYKTNADTSNPAYYHGDYKVGIRVVRATDENMVDTRHLDTDITYHKKALPKGYQSVSVHFYGYYRYMEISIRKNLNQGVVLEEFIQYHPEKKCLEKRISIIKTTGDTEDYIDNDTHIKLYLKEYRIGKKDLDHYYDEIVHDFVLKDWLTNYDSKYTTNDYGEFTTKTQWENW